MDASLGNSGALLLTSVGVVSNNSYYGHCYLYNVAIILFYVWAMLLYNVFSTFHHKAATAIDSFIIHDFCYACSYFLRGW